MSGFDEVLAANRPRLTIGVLVDQQGIDQYAWKVEGGKLPIMNLIGFITRVQSDSDLLPEPLPARGWTPEVLVIAWNETEQAFAHYVRSDTPVDPLLGMLEVAKACLVDTVRAGQATNQAPPRRGNGKSVGLFGPDGNLWRG